MTGSRSRSAAPRSAAAISSAPHEEAGPEFDERQHSALRGLDVAEWSVGQGSDPAEVDRGVLPTERPFEVDQPAGGQEVFEGTFGFGVDL